MAKPAPPAETGARKRGLRKTALRALYLALLTGACGDAAPSPDRGPAARTPAGRVSATDDVGRTVTLEQPARRVVSLLPAATETLFELGAGDRVVGRTRYDTDPRFAHLPSVGGGLDPSLETMVSLRPDLVVAWESATGSRIRDRLQQLGIPVFAVTTRDTAAIFRNIRSLGHLTGRDSAASALARQVRARIDSVRASVPPGPRPSVLFTVSIDPPMVSGTDNFIAEMIEVAGGEPVRISAEQKGHSPQVSLEELVRIQPDVVMLPVGGAPGASLARLRSEPGWRDLQAVREGHVVLVPAELTNRPGPSIGEMARVLRDVIRPYRPAP